MSINCEHHEYTLLRLDYHAATEGHIPGAFIFQLASLHLAHNISRLSIRLISGAQEAQWFGALCPSRVARFESRRQFSGTLWMTCSMWGLGDGDRAYENKLQHTNKDNLSPNACRSIECAHACHYCIMPCHYCRQTDSSA